MLALMKTLAWMVLQAAVVAWWLWVEYDSASVEGRQPNFGLAFGIGIFFAFIVTAGIIAARDLIARLRARAGRPGRDAPPVAFLGAAGRQIGQTGHQPNRLGTAGRSLDDLPKGRRSIGPG
jgi:hypothetical protein